MRKILSLALLLTCLTAAAQEHRSYDCYRTTGRIKVDGKLTEADWQAAPLSEAFVDIRGVDFQPAPTKQTYMKMLWDDDFLYIAGIIEEDDVTASLTERDAIIYKDNDFEVFIDPDGDGKFYFEFECNAFGTLMDLIMDRPYNYGGNFFMPWDCKGVRLKVHVDGKINSAHEHGSFWENAIANLRYGFEVNFRFNVYSGRLTQLLCLFILGMQLGRQRLFYDENGNLKTWHTVFSLSTAAVIALSFVDFGELESWLKPIYNLIILLMIVSAVVSAWYAFEGVRRVLHHLCIFGRMSLTNYLLQSIIGCAIFCGYGLACYYKLGITYAVMVGIAMVIGQYCFARYWFKSHPRGPLEGVWRKLTWI